MVTITYMNEVDRFSTFPKILEFDSWKDYLDCKHPDSRFNIKHLLELRLSDDSLHEVAGTFTNLTFVKGETSWEGDMARFILRNMLNYIKRTAND